MIGKQIKASYVESWAELVQNTPSCQTLYKHIKSLFEPEFYLIKLPDSLRLCISKFRTLNHRLPIQRGRYDRTLRVRNYLDCVMNKLLVMSFILF